MRTLIIAGGYPTDRYILNGIFEFDQAKALAKIGHEVYFLSIDIRSIRRIRRLGSYEIEKEGVLIHNTNFPCGRAPQWMQEVIFRTLLRKQYSILVKKHGAPDIIHAHFLDKGYYTVKELKKTSIPIVITEHSSGVTERLINKTSYKMGCITYREVDKLICVSNALAGQIFHIFGVHAEVVPNIVDVTEFQFNNEKRKTEGFTFVSVARLDLLKRISFLIDVFADIVKVFTNVQLIIVGDGPEKNHIMEKVTQYKIKDKVILKGQQERRIIKQIFDQADCFVLPSALETFGVVYIEALASGLPVIATKCGGPEDFVDESNGLLVEIDNREELFLAMKNMIEHIKRYDSENISKAARKKFHDIRIAKQLEMLYMTM